MLGIEGSDVDAENWTSGDDVEDKNPNDDLDDNVEEGVELTLLVELVELVNNMHSSSTNALSGVESHEDS